ncbi:MAG: LCP family protein [Porcipelethomonas sp.]
MSGNKRHVSQKSNPANHKTKPKKSRRKGGCLSKLIFSLLGVFLVLFGIYSFIVMSFINKINIVETGDRTSPGHEVLSSSSVKNILLIGTDSRGDDRGRSDSMILLSINSKTNKITMCSLMRDMYVQIPGYGGNKLNAAYSYGGPELLMDTIEENLYIDIDDYVTVNFVSFANIVDAVGGVEMEISDSEADAMNVLLQSPEGVSFFGEPSEDDLLDGGGTYNLSGKQALCYSRLRYVGNADFERTERQRKVLSAIIKKVANPMKIGSVAKEALPSMNTNMGKLNMYLLSLRAPSFLIGYDIEQMRVPADDTYWGSEIDGMSVLEVDFEENIDMIEDKLYGN